MHESFVSWRQQTSWTSHLTEFKIDNFITDIALNLEEADECLNF